MGLLDQWVDSEVTGSRRWRPHHEKRVLEIVKRVGRAEMGLNEEDGGSYLFLLFSLEKGRTSADGAGPCRERIPISPSVRRDGGCCGRSHYSFIQSLVIFFPLHFPSLPAANQ